MPRVIFVSNNKNAIYNSYTKEQIGDSPLLDHHEIIGTDLSDTEYIFSTWGMPSLTKDEIEKRLPKLKAIFYGAGSVQGFARPFLESGVKVFSAWAANAIPVAEFTAAQIILANKGYFQLHNRYKNNGYKNTYDYSQTFCGNYGAKVGILGAGMVGRYVIKLLKEYKLDIFVFDPFLPEEQGEELGVCKTDIKYIFQNCQTISNHLANNEKTKGMLDYSLFSLMKDNATFINTGRGAQVIEADLIRAMKEMPTRTALLDVTDPAEPLPQDSPIWECENILVTPHRAGSTCSEVLRMGEFMMAEYEALINNKPVKYEVTMKMLETMA